MAGLRSYVKQLGETRHSKEKLFAIEQEKRRSLGVILRHPSKELFDVIDTRQELEAVARVCTRSAT
jgi:hypothetical protein